MVLAEGGARLVATPKTEPQSFDRRRRRLPRGARRTDSDRRGGDGGKRQRRPVRLSSTCSSATPSWRPSRTWSERRRPAACCWRSRALPGSARRALMAEAKVAGQRGRDAGARARAARSSSGRSRSASCGSSSSRYSRRCRERGAGRARSPARRRSPSRSSSPSRSTPRPGPTRRWRRCTASTGWRRTSQRADGRSCSRSTTSTGAISRRCAGSPTCCRAWRDSPSRSLVGLEAGRGRRGSRLCRPDRRRPARDRDPARAARASRPRRGSCARPLTSAADDAFCAAC